MFKKSGELVFSPSDLICYYESPFASWMDRYYLENPGSIAPDDLTDEQSLIVQSGERHEQAVLKNIRAKYGEIAEIDRSDYHAAFSATRSAINARVPVIYQGALESGRFAGFTDFLIRHDTGGYRVWDVKLARSPKPYFVLQLCCYCEMYAEATGEPLPDRFGVILGTGDWIEYRLEDFIYYYRRLKENFLAMHDAFSGDLDDCPEPCPGAAHGRWTSYAERFFEETDHLVQVAGITSGQIKKLKAADISTMAKLAVSSGCSVKKLNSETLEKLAAQARLQCATREDRAVDPDAPPRYELLPLAGPYGEPAGLAALPPEDRADVFFDMEGYPLAPGGLEYLFGAYFINLETNQGEFIDWWAHNRVEEKRALEGFIDWGYQRWQDHPGMHVYHYAAYEVSAVRRLSTRHDTRQDEVDALLRAEVFVDLYRTVRRGLRIGAESYSIKKVELLYRPKRATEVATAVDSIIQYANWIDSGQPPDWRRSAILKDIRDYNEDDCVSTAELAAWLRRIALENGASVELWAGAETMEAPEPNEPPEEALERQRLVDELRQRDDSVSLVLADLVDFHRREEKPGWWKMFDRRDAEPEELRGDPACVEGLRAAGKPKQDKRSFVRTYRFDPNQECKLAGDGSSQVMFCDLIEAKFTLASLNLARGELQLKISEKMLNEKCGGEFPETGSIIPYEHVPAKAIQQALADAATRHLSGELYPSTQALLNRKTPAALPKNRDESPLEAAIRISNSMSGDCLVIQGPPGTGKTYTAARVIRTLIAAGKKVGVTSNSHKAVMNLLTACGEAVREEGGSLRGIKVGGDREGALFSDNPDFEYVSNAKDSRDRYSGGAVGGTAWLFARPEWEGALDYLFIDEAGQVSLANATAMSRCAKNLVLLGDQMQLEQPIQGSHPGDAGLSVLQYALKDRSASVPDAPVFHAVVPDDDGLFLRESRRMHPSVCRFISESIYEGRLGSFADCARQKIKFAPASRGLIRRENGIVFSGVEHDGNIQRSDEEVERIMAICGELKGRPYTDANGKTRPLGLDDILFIAPYNAQVRALQSALPDARVGSVDRFQGQEAPVCILSLCSSYGEYGSRGLAFILDRNRVNVAISRAQCLAVVVADPRIASAVAGSIDEMKLLNIFCKITYE
ncbi:MAG: TM0106 family RecB-like putative nuclease [bacterium]|nr:TM0106 family RecB-like putative nuclease [bacterium]